MYMYIYINMYIYYLFFNKFKFLLNLHANPIARKLLQYIFIII